jgi:hypothetical protein
MPSMTETDPHAGLTDAGRLRQEQSEDELIMDLEPDQFVAETSRPVSLAVLSARAKAGLWALRVFVVLVSLMVIYTFFHQLQ